MRLGGSFGLLLLCSVPGCAWDSYTDRGAAVGGLTGAGVGAIVGNQFDNAGAGTAIGAGIGALTGAAMGGALDEVDARNRAAIAGQLGRQVQPGPTTTEDVIAMTAAGVDPKLIRTHVERSGIAQPLAAADVIYLHQQGVSTDVIQAMQTRSAAPPVQLAQPPTIIEEHYYGPPCAPPPRVHIHHRYGRRPRVGWGFSFSG